MNTRRHISLFSLPLTLFSLIRKDLFRRALLSGIHQSTDTFGGNRKFKYL